LQLEPVAFGETDLDDAEIWLVNFILKQYKLRRTDFYPLACLLLAWAYATSHSRKVLMQFSFILIRFKLIQNFYESIKGLNDETVAIATNTVDKPNDYLLRCC
jgi:hypothetical protein